MHARQRLRVPRDVAHHGRQVLATVLQVAIADDAKLPLLEREPRLAQRACTSLSGPARRCAMRSLMVTSRKAMTSRRTRTQLGQAHHLAVGARDLADHGGRGRRRPAARGRPTPRCARRASSRHPGEYASGKTCPGWVKSAAAGGGIRQGADRVGAFARGDAGLVDALRSTPTWNAVPFGSVLRATMRRDRQLV